MEKLNILLVDDQPAKLLSYEAILGELGENLIKVNSGKQALEHLLKTEIAVVLVDVCMPELDGFELAEMIRGHPRFKKTAIIFISAVLLSDVDRMKGYELGAVDYVPVPVIPEVLRAKVRIFSELYRKTRALERMNEELEKRVGERTAELAASTARLLQAEHRRNLALAAGNMGSWEWNIVTDEHIWDAGQYRIFGVSKESFSPTAANIHAMIHPDDLQRFKDSLHKMTSDSGKTMQLEFRIVRPNGDIRWCLGSAASTATVRQSVEKVSGVTIDISDRKQTEERQLLLAREVDHRARNALAITQSILSLTRHPTLAEYQAAVRGRITALARAHTLLSESRWQGADMQKLMDEEFAPYSSKEVLRIKTNGPPLSLEPDMAQSLALVVHELTTNAAKYGALSVSSGRVEMAWDLRSQKLNVEWTETGGPECMPPPKVGLGARIISSTIETQLLGTCYFDWRPQGLRCLFSLPFQDKRATMENPTKPVQTARAEGIGRILVVEDEALIALMLGNMLGDLGFDVLGPFSTLKEASEAVENQAVDVALLDINLNGQLVYSLAATLQARGTPLLFSTGYATESVDPRFSKVPILQKPIDSDVLRNALYAAIGAKPRLVLVNT